jgi:hypothetical protein
MNATRDLTEAYQEWRRLAEAEGEAIRACNWGLVSACQKALQNLQARITRLSPMARNEWAKLGPRGAAEERTMQAAIRELIPLQRRNQTLIHAICEATRTKLEDLRRAGRNLKKLRNSYGVVQPAGRSTFS